MPFCKQPDGDGIGSLFSYLPFFVKAKREVPAECLFDGAGRRQLQPVTALPTDSLDEEVPLGSDKGGQCTERLGKEVYKYDQSKGPMAEREVWLVQIRVVVHQQTFKRLPKLAEFIARNLTFVDHVAFMGLEITGFTRANLDILWIDPIDYQTELRDAVLLLELA